MVSWTAPKNTGSCRRAVTISKQHAPSSKAGSAADLSGNKLGTLLATKIVCTVAFTQASVLEALQRKRSVGVPFDRPDTLRLASIGCIA